MKQNTTSAVMAQRALPRKYGLDFFPTPPWATRALFVHVLPSIGVTTREASAWEPACGEGHMSAVIEEFCGPVIATDIHDYSSGDRSKWPPGWFRLQDFLDERAEHPVVDWIITNPPFRTAVDFTLLAIGRANVGAAMLVRTQWIEGKARYERLFRERPPTVFAPFVERVPMVKGRLDKTASTATSYCWLVWRREAAPAAKLVWIPPCRARLERDGDYPCEAA